MAAMAAPFRFAILGANLSDPNWSGAPLTLAWHESAAMPQTPNGSMILGRQNVSLQNNDGTLGLTSGGPPQFLDVPAGSLMPSILVQNWKANSLKLTNLSANKDTPIAVQAYGPGLPGTPTPLLAGADPILLASGSTAAGKAPPSYAQLVMQSNTNDLTILALIGGPTDSTGNNGYLFALNYMGPPNPAGFTQVTPGNSISYMFYWTTALFVANLSPSNAQPAQVSLVSL
jgi:hypothetical protein